MARHMKSSKRHSRIQKRVRTNNSKLRNAFGRIYETYTADLLRHFVQTGHLRTVFATRRDGYWDKQKTDVLMIDCNGRNHRLQVKSSEIAAARFRLIFPDIPVFVPKLSEKRESALARLRALFPEILSLGPPNSK